MREISRVSRAFRRYVSIRPVLRLLTQDRAVLIFPEGCRSPNHALQAGIPGAAYIAMKSQAPILPIGITGTEKISAWRMPVPLTRFKVNIEQPFTLPQIQGTPSTSPVASSTLMRPRLEVV